MPHAYDPSQPAVHDGIFGLPHEEHEAALVYLPVPWEATTSYRGGTSRGPAAIRAASRWGDVFHLEVQRPYEAGLFMRPEPAEVLAWNAEAKPLAQRVIRRGGRIGDDAGLRAALARVNELSALVNRRVREDVRGVIAAGRIPAVVGGDHACPLGAFAAAGEAFGSFGLLHFDAHSDTRDAYEGFRYSHASILRNALEEVPQVEMAVQVGVRDLCEEEFEYMRAQGPRARVFHDVDLRRAKHAGRPWAELCREVVAPLPGRVWVTFDIDGLDPRFCPHTGTPVPGGLDLDEAVAVVREVVRSGRRIVGFDLCEVAPGPGFPETDDEWDGNVGMRLLYHLSAWTLASQGRAALRASP